MFAQTGVSSPNTHLFLMWIYWTIGSITLFNNVTSTTPTYWIIPSIGFISILIFPCHYSIMIIMFQLITFTLWSLKLLNSYLEQLLVQKKTW